jgi:AraC family transcriptional regulator
MRYWVLSQQETVSTESDMTSERSGRENDAPDTPMSTISRYHIDPGRFRREEYIARINRVIDYIEERLDAPLTLTELAEVAHFSRFHFHRIFAAIVGETLNHFIKRVRIEKAATQLVFNPKKSITEIALDCGFTSSATFARAFKQFYGISAGTWRQGAFKAYLTGGSNQRKNGKTDRKETQTIRKNGKASSRTPSYTDLVMQHNQPDVADIGNGLTVSFPTDQTRRYQMNDLKMQVRVEELSDQPVVYVRHIGPYQGDPELFQRLFDKLFTWAGPRGLLNFPETKAICVYHDNPELTDDAKLRTSVCITAPADTEVEGEIGKMTLASGTYALAHFELKPDEYGQAWQQVFGQWLPNSGYQPDDGPCFELYHNHCTDHPEGLAVLDICVPVKPL